MNMKQTGVTLLELMITIALAVILLAIGAPALSNLISSNAATMQTQNILSHLAYARQEAVDSQQSVTLCLTTIDSSNQESCIADNQGGTKRLLTFIDANQNQKRDANEQILSATDLAANMSLTGNRQFVMFKSDGTAMGSNMTFQLCISKQPRVDLVISPSGRSRAENKTDICA
ncbi:GspH/FimT family pseudopilin [Aeromonas caviae]